MEDKWQAIDIFDFSKDFNYIHCDTRDFHIIGINEQEPVKVPKNNNIFTKQEIKDFLKKLEEVSGGKLRWRMIRWKGTPVDWWKYLRFKKIGDDEYLGYTTQCNKVYPLYKSMTPETIDRQPLIDGNMK